MKQKGRIYKKWMVTAVLCIICIFTAVMAYQRGKRQEDLVYADDLDQVVLIVDGKEMTLKDIAFYIAYEEDQVEQKALVYDYENPKAYWNLHTNGVFVKISAKSAIMKMALHDEIFYQLAKKEEISLNEKEYEILDSSVTDMWNDLLEYDKINRLGIEQEDLYQQMEKVAIAQKYQLILSSLEGVSYEAYEFYAEEFEELLEKHKYKIKENVWDRVPIGEVTLIH